MVAPNLLYYGDNLDVLRRHVKDIKDDSVDLVYLDPPFNSDQSYNVLFKEQSGQRAASQIKAFEDTWHWDLTAARTLQDVVEAGGKVSQVMQAFLIALGGNDMLAYLAMMAPRLVELRRVLKPTGSIYLHCDPAASHYLKMLMDAVFGPQHFRNEVIWKRTGAHGGAKRFGPVHDVLLFYTKGEKYTWNRQYRPYEPDYLERFSRKDADGRLWQDVSLSGPGVRKGDSGLPWRDIDPTAIGRHWQPSSTAYEVYEALTGENLAGVPTMQERLDRFDATGLIYWPKKGKGIPRFKQYLDAMPGQPAQDVITDIPPINSQAQERLNYPTQKPLALLERIIKASTNEGDTVLDPFCGCGTTVDAAQRLGRRWVGIDITQAAIVVIKKRLLDTHGPDVLGQYRVIGEPTSVPDAEALAASDPYQFQWWALGLVHARPVEEKKGADQGIDGRLYFHDEAVGGRAKQIILSVKAGHTGRNHVHELRGVVDREKAEIGVLITMQQPTKPMREDAASSGFYHSEGWAKDYPRIQLLTIKDLLAGKGIEYPPGEQATFKQASRASGAYSTESLLDDPSS